MADQLELFERPEAEEVYMIAGWRQWADAGNVSSGLPQYLIEKLGARKIGRIKPDGFYLFQTPVSQFLFRPHFKFEEGYRKEVIVHRNEVFYWENGRRGLVIFLGDEPHMNVERYAEAFFDLAKALNVRRIAATGGVYALVPFDKHRTFSVTYAMPHMKEELAEYAVSFSNYEGGVSIGSYLEDRAEQVGQEYFAMYAFVPAYDFSQFTHREQMQPIAVENDYQAWHDAMIRLNHMFKLGVDLTELAEKSAEAAAQMREAIEKLARQLPHAPIKEWLAKLEADFVEMPFTKLADVWEDALGDIFKDNE
ncbi:MAG: PAC2 family protein [Candidatus Brachytrichaceae bacterium NZ_4S206]|jgi:proteasome assembly chaperone (PAC2) family protein